MWSLLKVYFEKPKRWYLHVIEHIVFWNDEHNGQISLRLKRFSIGVFSVTGNPYFYFWFFLLKKIPFLGNQKQLLLLIDLTGASFMALHFMTLGSTVNFEINRPLFCNLIGSFISVYKNIKFIKWVCTGIYFTGVIVLKRFYTTIDYFSLTIILVISMI